MASCRRRFPLESSNGKLGRPATEAKVEVSVREARVRGHSIRYEVTGEGEPMVLVHGLSGSTRWWVRNIPALAEHHRLYLVDLPGFGAMRHLRRQFTLVESASWLSAWMEAVGLGPAHLVGHSMGRLHLPTIRRERARGSMSPRPDSPRKGTERTVYARAPVPAARGGLLSPGPSY